MFPCRCEILDFWHAVARLAICAFALRRKLTPGYGLDPPNRLWFGYCRTAVPVNRSPTGYFVAEKRSGLVQHRCVQVVNVVPDIGLTQMPGIVVDRLSARSYRGTSLRVAERIHRVDDTCACVVRYPHEPGHERIDTAHDCGPLHRTNVEPEPGAQNGAPDHLPWSKGSVDWQLEDDIHALALADEFGNHALQ